MGVIYVKWDVLSAFTYVNLLSLSGAYLGYFLAAMETFK